MSRITPSAVELPDAGSAWITRTATDEQKILLMARLYRGQLERIRASVEAEHPAWTEQERRVEVAARISNKNPEVVEAARQGR